MVSKNSAKTLIWVLGGGVVGLAVLAWWQGYGQNISSAYQVFPLFGLTAFSLMWTHYIVAALKNHIDMDPKDSRAYFEVTSNVVLVAILLHPGLFAWQLWQDGLGLPPSSYFGYVAPAMKISIIAGMISLTAFLAYEFRRNFGKKAWWKYIQYASDVAMIIIFFHALRLGGQLQSGWFRYVWFFYGVSLLIAIPYGYLAKKKSS